jgi:hypothetical protein
MCQDDIDPRELIFEQRLIGDTDFCGRCFKEIITGDFDESLAFNLSSIRI